MTELVVHVLAAAVLVAPAIRAVGLTEQPDHPLWDVPAHELNMWGNVGHDGLPGENTNAVKFFVTAADPRPWIVALNEVCTPQWEEVADQLTGELGYWGWFVTTRADPPRQCETFGNVLFAIGPPTDNGLVLTYRAQDDDTEFRRLLCERPLFQYLDAPFTGCVTHLENNRTIATAQARQARPVVDAYGVDTGRFVAGDFNLERPGDWFDFYRDVDPQLRDTFPANGPNRRIDHIFGDRQHPLAPAAPNPFCAWMGDPPGSDHCYVSGTFHVG